MIIKDEKSTRLNLSRWRVVVVRQRNSRQSEDKRRRV
nr:MAG TPA_asm: hypothetical protein [Bacteriophage sp.]